MGWARATGWEQVALVDPQAQPLGVRQSPSQVTPAGFGVFRGGLHYKQVTLTGFQTSPCWNET
jgi:hypothetical protein